MRSRKTGGANAKMKKFPRILDYIEAHHPKYYKVIDDLAAHNAFTPRSGGGITVLLPDAKYVEAMQKAALSENPEDAADMIYSLAVPMLLPDARAWQNNREHVVSKLGRKITVDKIAGEKVHLAGDAVLEIDDKFQPFERFGPQQRGNMAVWRLKGRVQYNDAEKMLPKRRVEGANESNADEVVKNFVACVDRCELHNVKHNEASTKLNVLANYAKELEKSRDPRAELHTAALREVCQPRLAGGVEAAFYITFTCRDRSYNGRDFNGLTSSEFLATLIGTEERSELCRPCPNAFAYLCEFCERKTGGNDFAELDLIIDGMLMAPRVSTFSELRKRYQEYVDERRDQALYAQLAKTPDLKLLLDEFKFACMKAWDEYRRDPQMTSFKYNKILVKQSMSLQRHVNYTKFLNSIALDDDLEIVVINPESQSIVVNAANAGFIVGAEHIDWITEFLQPTGAFRSVRRVGGDDETEAEYTVSTPLSQQTLSELRSYISREGRMPEIDEVDQ